MLPASSVDTLVIHSSGSSDDSLFTGPQEFGFVSNRESALNPLVAQVTCFRDGSVVHVLKSNLMPVFDVDSVLLRVRPVTRSACGVLASSGPPPAAPGRTRRSSKRPRTERGSGSGSVEQTGSERSARGCCPLLAGGHGMVFAIVRAAAAYLARQWFKSVRVPVCCGAGACALLMGWPWQIPSSVAEVMAALNWLVHRSHIPVKVRTAQSALRTFQVVPHGMPRQHTHTRPHTHTRRLSPRHLSPTSIAERYGRRLRIVWCVHENDQGRATAGRRELLACGHGAQPDLVAPHPEAPPPTPLRR